MDKRERLQATLRGEPVDPLLKLGRKRLARPRALAGDFRAQRRNGTAMAGVVAMQRRQIGLDDGGQPLVRRRLFGQLAPVFGASIHRIGKSLDHQRFPRIEVSVEPAMGEPGLLHQVGDADAMRALLAKPHRGFLHDPRVGLELVFLRIAHR